MLDDLTDFSINSLYESEMPLIQSFIKYYKRSFEEEFLGAVRYIGLIYYTGAPEYGIEKDLQKCNKYLKIAADDDYEDAAQKYAAFLIEIGGTQEEIKNISKLE